MNSQPCYAMLCCSPFMPFGPLLLLWLLFLFLTLLCCLSCLLCLLLLWECHQQPSLQTAQHANCRRPLQGRGKHCTDSQGRTYVCAGDFVMHATQAGRLSRCSAGVRVMYMHVRHSQRTTQCLCTRTCSVLTFLKPPLPKLDIVSTRARASGGSSGRVRCTCRYTSKLSKRLTFHR